MVSEMSFGSLRKKLEDVARDLGLVAKSGACSPALINAAVGLTEVLQEICRELDSEVTRPAAAPSAGARKS
jgi:hypothetical protein